MNYLFDELDKTVACVGVVFSLILTIWLKLVIGHPIFIMIGILCFMSCLGYLIIKRFIYPSSILSLEELRGSNRFYITLNIIFFLLLSYSIIIIYIRSNPYIRPLGYFISTMLMAVIVANEILFLSPKKSHIYFTLCKIIIIGLSLQYSQILIFPSVVGVDTWYHQWFTLKILDNGYIPEGSVYSKLPFFHLMIGMTSLVTDLVYKMATMVSISSLQVICDAFFVFLLGKFLISTKVGLLAALLLEIANRHIAFGYCTIPNTMAAILILPIIFILLKLRRDKPFIGNSIAMFLMGTLILTHTVTSLFLAIFLFTLWLAFETYTRLFHQKTNCAISWTICTLFSTMMLVYWSYISNHIVTLSLLMKLGFQIPLIEYKYNYFSVTPFLEQMFVYLGMFLFFILSFIGCFYMISKQFRNSNRFISTIAGIVILSLAFFPLIVGMNIVAGRWFLFSQILFAIPLSLSLFLFTGMFKDKLMKVFTMSIFVFTLSILLIMSPDANMDYRFLSPNSGFRAAFTNSELQAIDTISEICNGTIGGDWYIKRPYKLHFNREFVDITDPLKSGDFNKLQNIPIIVREEILNYQSYSLTGSFNIKYYLHNALYNQKFSRIYNCGSTSGYLKP